MKSKDKVSEKLLLLLRELKGLNIKVRNIRCDNAEENHTAEEICKREFPEVRFEYTAPKYSTTKWLS